MGKNAPPLLPAAASSSFTRADSGEWAQGHERAQSTYPDKPTRRYRAGAQARASDSSSSPTEHRTAPAIPTTSFDLTPNAPSAVELDRASEAVMNIPDPFAHT